MKQIKLGRKAVLTRGDATEALAALPKGCVDLIWTDPPYGHNNNNNDDLISRREAALGHTTALGPRRPIAADDLVSASRLFKRLLRLARVVLKPGAWLDVCCGGGGGPKDIQFARWSLLMQKQLSFEQMVIWDKGPMGMGWRMRRSWECVLTAYQLGAKPKWMDHSKTIENIIRPGDYGIKKILPRKGQHPTEKPVELAALFIKLHTAPGDLVVDPFMGSGSTGVAALSSGRRFLGVELDPQWYAVAVRRLRRCVEVGQDPGSDPGPQGLNTLKPLFSPELVDSKKRRC